MRHRARPPVRLHVEELVLTGFDPSMRDAALRAFEAELTALIARSGVAGAAGAAVLSSAFTVPAGGGAAPIGAAIARAVHGAIVAAPSAPAGAVPPGEPRR